MDNDPYAHETSFHITGLAITAALFAVFGGTAWYLEASPEVATTVGAIPASLFLLWWETKNLH